MMGLRYLPIRLALPIPNVEGDWPELLLPRGMDSKAWQAMLDLLEVMRPGVVTANDRRPLLEGIAWGLRQALEVKERR